MIGEHFGNSQEQDSATGCTQLTGKTHMGQTLPPQKRAEGCIGLKYIESIFIDTEIPMWTLLQKGI